MLNKYIKTKIPLIYHLMRLDSPTGYLLSFFPSMFGLLLAYQELNHLVYIPLFFLGSTIARSAGCIINDLIDQNLDKQVNRTKNRPLASGSMNSKEAILFLAVLLCLCFIILMSLTGTSICVGVITFFMMSLYPLMKRITYFPQIFLGLTFNLGCLIGYSAIKDNITANVIIIYCACGFWTIAYDTIYAFLDINDDKRIGIKSTAILLEYTHYKAIILALYCIFIILFVIGMWNICCFFTYISVILCIINILWIIYTLDINNSHNCIIRFKENNKIGLILCVGLLLDIPIRQLLP